MLNDSFRPAAPPARARLFGLAACAWCAWMPAQAANVVVPEQQAPFKQYQGWRDEPLQDWRKANERVGAIGGWRTYLRESQPADEAGMERGGAHSGGHMNHGQ